MHIFIPKKQLPESLILVNNKKTAANLLYAFIIKPR
jgi:nitrogen fixation protein